MEDKELIQILQKNPEKGMKLVMKQYTGLCYHIVLQKLQCFSTQDIEECVSDVFVAFYQQHHQVDLQKGSIKSFLAVCARRKAIDYWRKLSKNQSIPLEKTQTPSDTLQKQQQKTILLEAIQTLGEPDGQILILKYYFGYSTKQIAQMFHLKENTVDQKIHRGLSKVKNNLEGGILL